MAHVENYKFTIYMAYILRVTAALLLLGTSFWFGWLKHSPLLVFLLAIVFTPSYIAGKWRVWKSASPSMAVGQKIRNILGSYCAQIFVAGIFFCIGLAFSAMAAPSAVIFDISAFDIHVLALLAVSQIILMPLIILLEQRHLGDVEDILQQAKDSGIIAHGAHVIGDDREEDDGFMLDPTPITVDSFFKGDHFSRRDYSRTAITDIVDWNNKKPFVAPRAATEDMIQEAEERLGFRLPETLRDIYKLQNGGYVGPLYVPLVENPRNNYDDWQCAFAHDYDVLMPLSDLSSLYDHHMAYFDEDYDDVEDKEAWISESEKLIVFAARTGYGTALDYRKDSNNPAIVFFDNNYGEREERERFHLESFDHFLSKLCLVEYDYGGIDEEEVVFGDAPDPSDGDAFWSKGNVSEIPLTEADWHMAGEKLGVKLPVELFPFYTCANGGLSHFRVAVQNTNENNSAPLKIFAKGPYVSAGHFLKVEDWVSLGELSDRLEFHESLRPWKEIHENSEKLIVMSAAYEGAILLDYREGDENPRVVSFPDLFEPESAIRFDSVQDFLDRLRRYDFPARV